MNTNEDDLLASLAADSWLLDPDLLDADRLRPLVVDWLRRYRKPNTRTEYLRDLGRAYAWFTAQNIVLLDAARPQLAHWAEQLRAGLDPGSRGPASEATVARRLSTLSSFFSFVVELREELTDQHLRAALPGHNPAANLRRPDLSAHKYGLYGAWLDAAQTLTLLRAARADTPRSFALVATMLSTAARTGEILRADVTDIGYLGQARVLSVPREIGLQYLPIDQVASAALDSYLGARADGPLLRTEPVRGHLGGQRLDDAYVLDLLRRLATEAGLPEEIRRGMQPHALRRAALTQAAGQGMSDEHLQTLAGFADVRSTRRYVHAAHSQDGSNAV